MRVHPSPQLVGYAEHYDPEFRMDTAFINRVGITSAWGYAEYDFYPPKAKSWLLKVAPFSFTQGGHDDNAGGNELLQVTSVRMQFSRQGNFRFDRFDGFEAWAGQRFDRARWRMLGGVQLYRWLSLEGNYFFGDGVFYDPVDPYLGRSYEGVVGITLQPSGRLSQALNYRRVSFDRASTGEHVYDIDLIYSRTTYQFSRQFYIRGIIQSVSSRFRVLTDFLASSSCARARSSTRYGSSSSGAAFTMASGYPARRLRREPARSLLQARCTFLGLRPASARP